MIIISIYIYISMVYQSIYQWLCINNVDNALAGGLENVKISWEFSLTKVGKCSVSLKRPPLTLDFSGPFLGQTCFSQLCFVQMVGANQPAFIEWFHTQSHDQQ